MSIDTVNDLPPRNQYVALAAQDEFDYTFPIFADSDLVVYVDGTLLTSNDYVVDGEGDDTGGTVTLDDALAGGEIVTIYRDIAIARDTDISQNGAWSSRAYNDEQDKIFLILQQLEAQLRRSLRLPIIADVDDADIEIDVASFANMYLTFDADGKPTPAALSAATMTQEIIGQLLYPRSAAEIAAGVVPVRYSQRYGWATRYGAMGDDVTDDAPAAQAALDQAAEAGGAPAHFPAPPIAYRINSQLEITPERSISITGDGYGWTSSGLPDDLGGGSCLRLDAAAGSGAAILNCAGFIMGLTIKGLHFYTREVGLEHVGIRLQEALQVSIRHNRFQGGSSASDDQIGIHLLDPTDFSGTYTGGFEILGNYFTTLQHHILAEGTLTTTQITDNNISGFTGSVTGIWLKASCVGVKMVNNRIEGCDTGFLDEGVGCDFSHGYFENNTVSMDRSAADLPIGAFNTFVSGGAPVLPSDKTKAAMNISPRNFVVDDTEAKFGRGYSERYRSFAMGVPQRYTPTFPVVAPMTYTSTSTSTVTGSTTDLYHTLSGTSCRIDFKFTGTVGGTPGTELRVSLPTDFNNPSGNFVGSVNVADAGSTAAGRVEIRNGEAFIRITKFGGGSFTAGSAGGEGSITYLANN